MKKIKVIKTIQNKITKKHTTIYVQLQKHSFKVERMRDTLESYVPGSLGWKGS